MQNIPLLELLRSWPQRKLAIQLDLNGRPVNFTLALRHWNYILVDQIVHLRPITQKTRQTVDSLDLGRQTACHLAAILFFLVIRIVSLVIATVAVCVVVTRIRILVVNIPDLEINTLI